MIAVPVFKKFGFGAVLGYLAAGVVLGPDGLGFVQDADRILGAAEIGVVMLLFVIGLELSPARLKVMRRSVFGAGAAQVALSGLVLGGLLVLMLPLSRVVPPLYQFRVRRRVFRWYARLREVEHKLDAGAGDADGLLKELADLDRVVNKVAVPLSYADELYALRNNIDAVRKRVLASAAPAGAMAATA